MLLPHPHPKSRKSDWSNLQKRRLFRIRKDMKIRKRIRMSFT